MLVCGLWRLLRLVEASLSLHLSLCPRGGVCPTQQFDSTKTLWPEALSKNLLTHIICGLSFMGQATSQSICTSIEVHTFLHVQKSLSLPIRPTPLSVVNITLKLYLYSAQLSAILKTIITCNHFGIICVKVGNIEGNTGK